MRTILQGAVLLVSSLLFIACGEKEKTGPAIFVSPSTLILEYEAGDVIEFDVEAIAGDYNLRQVRIAQKPEGGITTVLLDTMVAGSKADFFYVYHVPVGAPRVLLTFIAYDTDGNEVTTARDLYVDQGEYLSESTGHLIYSPFFSGSNNAFNIASLTYLQMDADPDSALVDIIGFDESNDESLFPAIRSLSGIRFVRNNAFNYAQASASSAEATFTSSVAQSIVLDVQMDDILITEYDTVAHKYAVIRFTGVYDEPAQDQDRFVFNVKK